MPTRGSHFLSYDDPRSHDRFDIYLTDSNDFDFCRRHVCGIGNDPVVYERLNEIPQPIRSVIENLIAQQVG